MNRKCDWHEELHAEKRTDVLFQECDPPDVSKEGEGTPLISEHCSKTLEKELEPFPSSGKARMTSGGVI